jgi:hypothetical protein
MQFLVKRFTGRYAIIVTDGQQALQFPIKDA